MKFFRKLKEKIVLFGLMLISLTLVACNGSFSTDKLKTIELGNSQEEVEKILGKPHDKKNNLTEKWYYFEDSFKNKYSLSDNEKEDDELKNMTYKCTIIEFDANDKVIEVFYDSQHKYEKDNDYATTAKTLSEVNLFILDFHYYLDKTEEESVVKIINKDNLLSYETLFSDGSYIHSYAKNTETLIEGDSAKVSWKDALSEYEVTKKANRIGTFEEDGAFTLEYAEGDIVLPEGVKEITEEMFLNKTQLTSIVLPNSVVSIGKNAFKGCSKLTSVFIPNSVLRIDDGAFEDCKSLNRVTLEENSLLEHLGKKVFNNTSINFNSHNGCKYLSCGSDNYFALISVEATSSTITINKTPTIIADDAFNSFSGVVVFEDRGIKCNKTDNGLELIDCLDNSITELIIQSYITSIGDYVLDDCAYLRSISLPAELVYEINGLTSLVEVNITSGTHLNEYAFDGCGSIESITLPKSLISIGSFAFYNCDSLTSILIPSNVTSIENNAFQNCSKLVTVLFEKESKLLSIGNDAFINCDSLTSIVIPSSVLNVGGFIFSGCNIVTIYCEANSQPNEWDSYWNSSNRPVYWGVNEENYLIHEDIVYVVINGNAVVTGHKNNVNEVVIPSTIEINGKTYSVTGIKENAFDGCTSLTSIKIPNSITDIGENLFDDCLSLHYNEYENCHYLGNETNPYLVLVKAKDTSITKTTIHNNTKFIMNDAFNSCISLQYNEYGNCYYLGSENNPYRVLVKAKDTSITEVTTSNKTDFIMGYAFQRCWDLTSIEIPHNVTCIKDATFSSCRSLTSIVIPNNVTSIGDYAFQSCSKLSSITFEEGSKLINIGKEAFNSCASLTSIVIPESVTSIGKEAFVNCSTLTIYCETSSKPSGWDKEWNSSNRPVYWNDEWSYVSGVPTPNK